MIRDRCERVKALRYVPLLNRDQRPDINDRRELQSCGAFT